MSDIKYTCYLFVNQRLKLKSGKVASQTAHAMRLLINNLPNQSDTVKNNWKEWEAEICKTITLKILNENEMEEIYNRYPGIIVVDAGRTCCPPNSKTILALYPLKDVKFSNSLY